MDRLLVEISAASDVLGVGRSTVYVLISRGELRTVKIGRRSLITAESLRAFVDRLTGAGADRAS